MNLLFYEKANYGIYCFISVLSASEGNPPGRGDVNASAGGFLQLTETKRKNAGGPDWTYYVWISAAFVLVAIVGLTENLINAERR